MAFMTPENDKSFLQKLATGLQGLGAGIQGQGAQFAAMQEAKRQQLSKERMQAAAEDIRRAKMLYDAGDAEGIRSLASERAGLINQLGGDPSDTLGIQELAIASLQGDSGAWDRLGGELNMGFQAAVDNGFIKPMQSAQPLSPEGKKAVDIARGFISEEGKTVTLSDTQAKSLGFKEGSIVQQAPDGTLKVISEPEEIDAQKAIDRETKLIEAVKKDKRVDNFIQVSSSLDRVRSAANDAAGDVSLVFAFMKMLDPGSVVREGEFATAENSAGIPERVRVQYNKAMTGERLSPDQRDRFKAQAESIYSKSKDRADNVVKSYESRAKNQGLDPSVIRGSVFVTPEETIQTDYVFDENGVLVPNPNKGR